MKYSSLLYAPLLILFLGTCGSAEKSEAEMNAGEPIIAQPNAFDAAEAALENGAGLASIRDHLINNYAKVSDAATGRIDPRAGRQYIDLATTLADEAAGDTVAALPLYKAAEVYQALSDFEGAARVFKRINTDYPGFSKAGEALFMLAFTYDENLKDFDRARETYERFIDQYPGNTFVDDAEMLIDNLGKTDEEILKSLERQQ